jgi:imidazole glycerol-phosphate synthase subunit HisH
VSPDVVLVDAGGSNLGSVRYALERLGIQATVSADAPRVRAASHVILPGVGAAAPGMARLRSNGMDAVVRGLTQPVLGVCLGMQLLFERSQESDTVCLGLIPGCVQRLDAEEGIRIPHMGWNSLQLERDNPLFAGVGKNEYVYFVHSYAAPVSENSIATCVHGTRFSAAVSRNNFYGVQFHPERSGPMGATILRNFVNL